jgi:N6-L-threonylcarbamoyladenine synthase
MAAAYLDDKQLTPPFITLLASGGHTAIIHTKTYTDFDVLGSTLDDAAGEAFDKVARILNLEYPGGPNIEKLALTGQNNIILPKMLKGENGYNFSYSGLKTAIINYCHNCEQKNTDYNKADVASSFQSAAVGALIDRVIMAAVNTNTKIITCGGGVIANGYLRDNLAKVCIKNNIKLVLPQKKYCTDNAAMIAMEGLIQYKAHNFAPMTVNACAQISLGKKGKV